MRFERCTLRASLDAFTFHTAFRPDVKVVQSSGATLLDLAAQRAIYSAAPFGPLPKDYGTNRKTIQASFKPTT